MVVVIYLHWLWLAVAVKEVAKDLLVGGNRKTGRGPFGWEWTRLGATRGAEVFAVAAFVTVIYFCYAFLSHNFAHSESRPVLVRSSIFCSCG